MNSDIGRIFIRDLRLAGRAGGSWAQAAIFFILFMMLAAFALGSEQASRSMFAPALVWLAVCLSSQLSLEQLFARDLDDGTLDCWLADDHSMIDYVIGKFLGQWMTTFLPVLFLAPLAAMMLGAKPDYLPTLLLSLLVGGPALVFFGGMASALSANIRGSGLLIVLLSGPLLASPLIFGVDAAQAGILLSPALKILGAISLASSVFCPLVSAMALKVHLE
jgi:heme exporter protein B